MNGERSDQQTAVQLHEMLPHCHRKCYDAHLQWQMDSIVRSWLWCKLHPDAKWQMIATSTLASIFIQKIGNQRWRRFNTFIGIQERRKEEKSSSHHHKPMTDHRKLPLRRVAWAKKSIIDLLKHNLSQHGSFVDVRSFINLKTIRRGAGIISFLDDQKIFRKSWEMILLWCTLLSLSLNKTMRAPLSRWRLPLIWRKQKEKTRLTFILAQLYQATTRIKKRLMLYDAVRIWNRTTNGSTRASTWQRILFHRADCHRRSDSEIDADGAMMTSTKISTTDLLHHWE